MSLCLCSSEPSRVPASLCSCWAGRAGRGNSRSVKRNLSPVCKYWTNRRHMITTQTVQKLENRLQKIRVLVILWVHLVTGSSLCGVEWQVSTCWCSARTDGLKIHWQVSLVSWTVRHRDKSVTMLWQLWRGQLISMGQVGTCGLDK